ncbi:MAG: type II toxin-antitoxin system VapC family toxin [Akkermansiaceae bacterium]
MIHLDTNILIDIVTTGSPQVELVRGWLESGKKLGASAIAWSEFCNGPHSREQKDAVFAILRKNIHAFDVDQAVQASRLFHYTGRKRGSHADCMIAAAAMCHGIPVATRNIKDFQKFVPHGLKLEAIPTQSA